MLIEKINSPSDLKTLSIKELETLASEIRDIIITKTSKTGGHLASNLGVIELTIALHYVFDMPSDKLIFDVSHQCYTHKILTGRKDAFIYDKHFDDISNYSNPDESEYDNFVLGHTSSSISLLCGLIKSRDILGKKYNAIAVIGDGSLSGGLAFEGLDNLAEIGTNAIVIVNDNGMSIGENHGGIYSNLKALRLSKGKAKNNYFKTLNLDYIFEPNGNNIASLIKLFGKIKNINHPVVLHIVTKKGNGFDFCENNLESWHNSAPFDPNSGKQTDKKCDPIITLTQKYLLKKAKLTPNLVVVTAGTPSVLNLNDNVRNELNTQYIDCGIAEGHVVTFASSLAKNGIRPVVPIYSSFVQRAYDELSQDVGINNSPAVFILMSASVLKQNSVTHYGIYDIPLISHIPNIKFLAPKSAKEYLAMLDWAINQTNEPVVIKAPAILNEPSDNITHDYSHASYNVVNLGKDVCIMGLGSFFGLAKDVANSLKSQGINASLIEPIFVQSIDTTTLNVLAKTHKLFVSIEDGSLDGGWGQKVATYLAQFGIKTLTYGVKKGFYDNYDISKLLKENRLNVADICQDIIKNLSK